MRPIRLLILLLAVTAMPAVAQSGTDPYVVSVWATVVFGEDGAAREVSVIDEGKYPPKFVENVKARFARARVPPPKQEGQPAILRSGVELRFMVTPTDAGGTVRLDGIAIGPVPKKQPMAKYPEDVKRSPGWKGEVTATCTVSPQGRCSTVEIASVPGMPESVRKFAKTSLEHWEFEPQQVNGKPIEGEFRASFMLNTGEAAPEDFRDDKFLRILRGR